MLTVRCRVLSCLSVTLVYCGQTVGRIKMKLGMRVRLGPGHIVLGRDPAPPPPKGHSPPFAAHICCGQMAAWTKMPLGTEVGLDAGDIVLDEDPAPLPEKEAEPPPKNLAHVYCGQTAGCMKTPLVTEVALRPGFIVLDRWSVGTQLPSPKRVHTPNFRPMSIMAKRLDG